MARPKHTIFILEVEHPLRGPILVGPYYRSRDAAKSWLSFVRNAWVICPVRVRGFTLAEAEAIKANGGQIPESPAPAEKGRSA